MNLCWKKRLKFHLQTLLGPYIKSLADLGATKNQYNFFPNLPACMWKHMQWYREPFHEGASENQSALSASKGDVLFVLTHWSACLGFALQLYCRQRYDLPSLCRGPCVEPRMLDEGKRYHAVRVNLRNTEAFEELDVSSRESISHPR